jgi:hypothetical protein
MKATIERLDIDRLTQEITESAKHANGVRYPSDRETNLTIELIQKCWEAFRDKPPQEGEWVKIDEEFQRIGYVLDQVEYTDFQPAKNGSVYLSNGHGSFSGSFESPVKMKLEAGSLHTSGSSTAVRQAHIAAFTSQSLLVFLQTHQGVIEMAKWSLLLLVCLCCGCASQRTRITLTRVGGQPSISIELMIEQRKTK